MTNSENSHRAAHICQSSLCALLFEEKLWCSVCLKKVDVSWKKSMRLGDLFTFSSSFILRKLCGLQSENVKFGQW